MWSSMVAVDGWIVGSLDSTDFRQFNSDLQVWKVVAGPCSLTSEDTAIPAAHYLMLLNLFVPLGAKTYELVTPPIQHLEKKNHPKFL